MSFITFIIRTSSSHMKTALAAFSAICLSLAFAVPPVPAHEGATGVVKERMMMMDGSKKSVKALARIFKGQDGYEAGKVAALARDLERSSGKHLTSLFPEGSLEQPSEASEEIWDDWEDFIRYADDLDKAARQLAENAGSGKDASEDAFRDVVKACRGCHDEFRED